MKNKTRPRFTAVLLLVRLFRWISLIGWRRGRLGRLSGKSKVKTRSLVRCQLDGEEIYPERPA